MPAYGLIRQIEDRRDHKFMAATPAVRPQIVPYLQPTLSVAAWCPPVLNQGNYGTCTGHAVTESMRYDRINNGLPDLALSIPQLYYDSGKIEGDTRDVGRQLRDVIKAAATTGVAPDDLWPYHYDHLDTTEPPGNVKLAALQHTVSDYQSIGTDALSTQIALFLGRPVVIGVDLFAQFESDEAAETGVIRMPKPGETSVGAHAMLLIGRTPDYDIVRNSWGPDWGDHGNCRLPRGYTEAHGFDFWVVFANT